MNTLIEYIRRFSFWLQSKLQWIGQWLKDRLEDSRQKNTIAALDGIRAIAALLVLAFHIGLVTRDQSIWIPADRSHRFFSSLMMFGWSGVTLFFVLSGFLLFLPYAKSLLSDSIWPSARHFYLRRVFRIVPAYYVSLFLMILLFRPEYLHRDHLQDLGLFLTFFMDSKLSTWHNLNGPFWTLAIEWQYYMLLPLLVLGIRFIARHGSLRRRLWTVTFCLLGLISWGVFSRYWGFYFLWHPDQTVLVPRSVLNVILFFGYGIDGKYLEDFAVGMLIGLWYVFSQRTASDSRFSTMMSRLSPWLWRMGILLLIFMAMWSFNQTYHEWNFLQRLFDFYNPLKEVCISIGFGLIVAAVLFGPAEMKRPFTWRPLRWLGVISYSLYMWHLQLLFVFWHNVTAYWHGWNHLLAYSLYWLFAFVVIIPFALLFYLWVEKPWMQIGEKLRARGERKT